MEWATHQSELNRKISQELVFLAEKNKSGEISDIILSDILGSLWRTTSGLIDSDLAELIAQCQMVVDQELTLRRLYPTDNC